MKRIIAILFLFLNLNSFADGCSGDATFIATYDPLDCCWSFVNTTTNDCMEWNCTWDFGDGSPPVTTAQGVGTACHPYMYSGTYTVTLTFDSSPCHGGSGGICIGTQEVTIPPLSVTPIVSNYNGYNVSCEGASDGWITLNSAVGYSYEWQTTPIQYGNSISNLTAGTYFCNVGHNGCVDVFTITITEPPLLISTSNLELDTCNSGMAEVIVSGGVFPYNYLWTDNQITPVINNLSGGDYSVIITDANNCKISDQFYIDPGLFVDPIAEFNVVPDLNMHHLYKQMDNPIYFLDKSVNEFTTITKWFWEFEDGFSSTDQDTKHSFEEIGDFNVTLAIENLYGCVDTITKRVIVEDFLLYIPNSFTPDGDGINDSFLPKGMGVKKYKLDIFNRWGARIFSSNHLSGNEEYCPHNQQDIMGWNGTTYRSDRISQLGVYVYLINLEDVFGMPHQYMGQVTLIR